MTPLKHHQHGLTMIELMVTLLLSSFLLLGVLQLFINSSTTDRANSALARLQENGRVALDMIKQDFRRTGYQGCATPSVASMANSTRTFPLDALGQQGTEQLEGAGTANDSLIMRHATPARMRAATITPTQITFISSNVGFTEGSRYEFILTDCENVAIFTGVASARTANIDPATQGQFPDQYTLTSLQGANNGAPPSIAGITTGEGSQFLFMVENAYRVQGDPANLDAAGNPVPTLYKNGDPMIANVDNFQVLYGLQNAGGQTTWMNAGDLTDASRQQISRLQISLVMSSPDEVTDQVNAQAFAIANIGANTQLNAIADRRLRRVFTTVVDVRNRQ